MYVSIKDFSLFQSIFSIKQELIRKDNKLKKCDINLKYGIHILEDKKTLYDYKIKKDENIEVVIKNKGGTMAKAIEIIIFVFIFIFFFFFLALGVIPFISFIIPNIIIKGLYTIVNYLYSITDPNNFLYSLLYFCKSYAIPFLQFIFEYFGLFIFTFFITFFCTYKIYYYAKKEDSCAAFNVTKVLSGLTSLIICGFYFIANSATFFRSLANFIPEPINKPFIKLAEKIPELRLNFIGYIPYIGQPQLEFILAMTNAFKGIGMFKLFGSQILENWDLVSKILDSDEVRKSIQESGVDEIIKYIKVVEKAESHYEHGVEITANNRKNANNLKEIIPTVSASATAYVLRAIFHNIVNMILEMTFFINICKTSGKFEEESKKIKEEIEDLMKEKNKNIVKSKIEDFAKRLQDIDPSNIVDIFCLKNTLISGATFSILITFIFLILFIIFFFVKL